MRIQIACAALIGGVLAAASPVYAGDDPVAAGAAQPGPERGMAPPSDPKAVSPPPGEGSERAMATKPPAPADADTDKAKMRAMTK